MSYDDLIHEAEGWRRLPNPPPEIVAKLLAAVRALETENERLLSDSDRQYADFLARLAAQTETNTDG